MSARLRLPAMSQRLSEVVASLAETSERITELLAFALTLDRDPLLRATLRQATGPVSAALALGEKGPFLGFAEGRLLDAGSLEPPPSRAGSA